MAINNMDAVMPVSYTHLDLYKRQNHSFFDIEGLIPYYAFHMPLFIFISGYFFRMKEGESLWRFAKRKFLRLMIPYYLDVYKRHGFTKAFKKEFGFSPSFLKFMLNEIRYIGGENMNDSCVLGTKMCIRDR